ncbi:MAG: 1-deoxy-D-xylulose-5-phosphate synthase [Elusimicrobiota bacterium]
MSVLEKINKPQDLRIIKRELLTQLAEEIRGEIIRTVSQTGGHLAPSLGTVELTIALHYVFEAPKDKIVWDVGHQSYAHKIITGRRDKFHTLRTYKGISGFPKRDESEYDSFGAGHSSTSISAALGIAAARDLKKEDYKVIAILGDGSMTGGLAFEGLQNAGHLGKDLLVILNDNEMFISHRVGAVAGYLAKLLTAGTLKKFEKSVETFFKRIHFWGSTLLRVAKRFKVLLFPGMLFEEMGFAYIGPVDGHDLHQMIEILSAIRQMKGPILLHVITKKGKGYQPAEDNPIDFHGVGRFNIITGETEQPGKIPSYTQIFGQTLVKLAADDPKVVAITAAMSTGTGMDSFAKEFPERFFDVGIAESHALTFAAGLAAEGMKPVCSIYSTFLQRGMDQIIHDIALQKLPVVICVDRAGIVGEDGATHQGAFDLSFLNFVPNLAIMAPADENELQHMLKTALLHNGPTAIRYPRGSGVGVNLDVTLKKLPFGKAEIKMEGKDVSIFAIGNTVHPAMDAAKILQASGIHCAVVNMRYLKPLDDEVVLNLASKSKKAVVIEENSAVGGLGSSVSGLIAGKNIELLHIAIPDKFIEHGSQKILRELCGFTPEKIAGRIKEWIK